MNVWDEASFAFQLDADHAAIVEVGGFEGRWLAEMRRRYGGRLIAFEPQEWAHERLRARVIDRGEMVYPAATLEVEPYGLSAGERGRFEMGGWGTDACSFLLDDAYFTEHPEEGRRDRGLGELRPVAEAFDGLGLSEVAVMCVNIEGYEYKLIPAMAAAGLLPRIAHLMIQFHRAHDPSRRLEAEIRAALAPTHDLAWEWPALACWTRRGEA